MIKHLAARREQLRRQFATFVHRGPPLWPRAKAFLRRQWQNRLVRRSVLGLAAVAALFGIAFGGLSWRLSRGPISLDIITPLLTAAIQQNFGGRQSVTVGGTVIEHDKSGRTQLRLTDVVLRDRAGSIVASAPKVEIGLSVLGLLIGNMHAERLRLVGAEIAVRIERNGQIAVFAGSNTQPLAVAAPAPIAVSAAKAVSKTPSKTKPESAAAPPEQVLRRAIGGFAALLAWIDGLGQSGLDGHELSELGLLNGTLVVDDRREGRQWSFKDIDVSLNRLEGGGVEFAMRSDQTGREWSISAAASPGRHDRRIVRLQARHVPARDILLALRPADLPFSADLPISVNLRGEIGANGVPDFLRGGIVAEPGTVSSNAGDAAPLRIDGAELDFDWNGPQRMLLMPLHVEISGDRFTLFSRTTIPADPNAPWTMRFDSGNAIIVSPDRVKEPLLLSHIQGHARLDFARSRIELVNAELGNNETSIAASGGLDYSGPLRVTLGLAARRMSLSTLKLLWPAQIVPPLRAWVDERITAGSVDRIDIGVNAPLRALEPGGPPTPDDGLSITIAASKVRVRPLPTLPAIEDADLEVQVTGRTATVRLGQGTAVLSSGRKLTVSSGVFNVPDTAPKRSPSKTRFRVSGLVGAGAELMATDFVRESAGIPLDPAKLRGKFSADVTVGMVLSRNMADPKTTYTVDADLSNFAGEHLFMGKRLEAASMHLSADNHGYDLGGDVRIAGTAASLDYRKQNDNSQAEVRLRTVLDEATRGRLGLDFGSALRGPVPVKLAGTLMPDGKSGRFAVSADLSQADIQELLPGWVKPPTKPAHAGFTLVTGQATTRLQDFRIDGPGTTVRGSIELDASGNLITASFPVFSPSGGDKVSLKADRGSDGALHVVLRGDVFDGRQFIKSEIAGPSVNARGEADKVRDLDLELKLGAIAGFHGEALRSTELKLSRRNGKIRKFSLKAKLGQDATLVGELRTRGSGRPGVYLETDDAGALFRFTDTYSRLYGGRMSMLMDAPTADLAPQQGVLVMRDFAVRGEAALNRVVAQSAPSQPPNVAFTAMRVNFTRRPGRLSIRNGVVRGPLLGATMDGEINYRNDNLHMRGTFVPLYGLNNMFGQLPIVGILLGGGKDEGLVGVTYEVVGTPSAPVLRVNPISAVAPGFIRKLFEFPSADGQGRDASPPVSDSMR